MLRRLCPLVAVAALAALAPAAHAASVQLGFGQDPNVAVDENGDAHVAWNEPKDGTDVLHYCRIPHGTTACASELQFSPSPDDEHGGPRVFTREPGEVFLLTHRCCTSDAKEVSIVFHSSDGGVTFDAGHPVGDNEPSGDAILGPGQFTISTVSNDVTAGLFYQSEPTDSGFATNKARLNEGGPQFAVYDGGIGLVDAETPIVAYDDHESVFYRIWNSGDLNDQASWKPAVQLDSGDAVRMATGPRGTYLMYENGGGGTAKLVLRKLDRTSQTFDGTRDVSPATSPISPELSEDLAGNVNAVWRDSGHIMYRSSTDGQTLNAARQIGDTDTDGGFIYPQSAGGPDGKGFVVYADAPNSTGAPIRAIPIDAGAGSTGPPPPTCAPISVGVARAIAVDACFTTTDKKTYRTQGAVLVNGVSLEPDPGTSVTTSIDRKAGTIKTDGAMSVLVGKAELAHEKISWHVGSAPSAVETFHSTEQFPIKILGFNLHGDATLTLKKGGADIPTNLTLPTQFWQGITAPLDLKTNSQGLNLKGLKVPIPKFPFGFTAFGPFKIDYLSDNPFTFRGSASLPLPTPDPATLNADFLIQNGVFQNAHIGVDFQDPGLPLVDPVFLNSVDAFVNSNPKPASITGKVALSAGPKFGHVRTVGVDGKVTYTFPSDSPANLHVGAELKVLEVGIGEGHVDYSSDNVFSFGAKLGLNVGSVVSLTGNASGFVDIPHKQVFLGADAHLCFFGKGKDGKDACGVDTEFAAGNKGIGACVDSEFVDAITFDLVPVKAGFNWRFPGIPLPVLLDCSVDEFKPASKPALRAARAGGVGDLTLDSSAPSALIEVKGSGGTPRVHVSGPGGAAIDSPTDPNTVVTSGNLQAAAIPQMQEAFIRVDKPAAGPWHVEALPGSPAIASIESASGHGEVKVKAKVTGHGRRRVLSYSIAGLDSGSSVHFAETGTARGGREGGADMIGSATHSHGKIRFEPGPGAAGKRDVVAQVEQGGLPRSNSVVASFVAPGPPKPGRPAHLRAKLRGSTLKLSWRRARNAQEYEVRVALRHDGRVVFVRTRRPALVLKGVRAPDSGVMTVSAIRPLEGSRSRAAKARIRLKRPRHRRGH